MPLRAPTHKLEFDLFSVKDIRISDHDCRIGNVIPIMISHIIIGLDDYLVTNFKFYSINCLIADDKIVFGFRGERMKRERILHSE